MTRPNTTWILQRKNGQRQDLNTKRSLNFAWLLAMLYLFLMVKLHSDHSLQNSPGFGILKSIILSLMKIYKRQQSIT